MGKGKLLVQIRNEVIEGQIFLREGAVHVQENSSSSTAAQWIVRRIAQLPLLADRILSFVPTDPTFVVPNARLLGKLCTGRCAGAIS
jgi:hypothetical protein